ncbi:MAG TPA: hypothetical protein PKL82_02625 [Anaerolineaceae bacterium]|nr:hypothetical protein [Anaerolineaceae bacterium]HOG77749.1 hypothetical protein [Anaerolineaceae bacterium]
MLDNNSRWVFLHRSLTALYAFLNPFGMELEASYQDIAIYRDIPNQAVAEVAVNDVCEVLMGSLNQFD